MLTRNGIRISLCDASFFAPGSYATMHLFREGGYRVGDNFHPEVDALECLTPLMDFCTPPDARYEVMKMSDGDVVVQVFAREMPNKCVLEWVFPNPKDVDERMYHEFTEGL